MDHKQIDRQELDDYITREPNDLAEDEYGYYAVKQPYTPLQIWLDDWRMIMGNIFRQFWTPCPSFPNCRIPERFLWFKVGKHENCLPF